MNEMEAKWISGKQGGKLVKVLYTLPIKFKLEDDVKSIGKVERKAENAPDLYPVNLVRF